MNSQYYILKPAVDTEETGHVFPAVESYDDYDFKGPNSVHKLNSREFPNFVPDLRFKLAKGAKLCDMMGQATINAKGFLISEKLKSIIEHANTVPCKFYNATIEAKGDLYNYYWVHFVWEDGKQLVDYPNSKFFKRKFSNNLGYLNLNSETELLKTIDEYKGRYMIGFELIKMKGVSFEIISVPFNIDILISDRLKQNLMNCTGIQLEFPNYIQFIN